MGIGDKLKEVGKSITSSGSEDHEISMEALKVFFVFSIFIHLYDAITGFQRGSGSFIVYIYVIMIVCAYIFLFKMRVGGADEVSLLIVIVFSYALPYIPSLFPDNRLMMIISGILFLIPLLPLYLGLKFSQDSFVGKVTKFYMVFWLIILIFYVLTTFAPAQQSQKLVANPFVGVRFVTEGVGKTIDKTMATFKRSLDVAIAKATGQPNPGTEESQVGVYVEKVKSVESKYSNNSDVYVEAKIRAVNVKEPLRISTLCYIDGVTQGATRPSVLEGVVGKYDNYIDCNLGKLPVGQHTVKVKADFEFEGSSDIKYTFVSADIKDDQYSRLGINPSTIATYSGGPVALGLTQLNQPLKVYLDKGNADAANYRFGISLENKWQQGKVVRGIRYVLDTPGDVKLVDCNRNVESAQEPNADGRNEYTFNMNTENAQGTFDAITCRMYVANINALLSSDANVRTFAGKALYEYVVEGSTTVIVE